MCDRALSVRCCQRFFGVGMPLGRSKRVARASRLSQGPDKPRQTTNSSRAAKLERHQKFDPLGLLLLNMHITTPPPCD